MRLSDLTLEKINDRSRLRVTVDWEDCSQPKRELYIETMAPFAADLSENIHSFLVGCIIPAMHFGERRISLNEKICPTLKEGLETVQALMVQWSYGQYRPLLIEAKPSTFPKYPSPLRHAALFFPEGSILWRRFEPTICIFPRIIPDLSGTAS